MISPETNPVLERLRADRIWRAEHMNVVRHDDVATNPPEICRLPCRNDQSRCSFVCEQRSSPICANCEEMMIDRNPTSTVGKCAGFCRSDRGMDDCWRNELLRARASRGVAELRPPSARCSAFTIAVFALLLLTSEFVYR